MQVTCSEVVIMKSEANIIVLLMYVGLFGFGFTGRYSTYSISADIKDM